MIATGNPATVTMMTALNVQSGRRNRPPIISNASMTPKPTTAYTVTSRVTPRRFRSAMNRDSLEGLPDIACLDWYIAIYNLSNYKSNEIIPKNLQGLNGCNAIKLYLGCPYENHKNILCPYGNLPLYHISDSLYRENRTGGWDYGENNF